MKTMALILAFLFAPPALGGTQAIFSKDGSKATILMFAISTNPDAMAFNDAINLPAEDMNGKATKRFSFVEDNGAKSFDVICAFSKLVGSTGSCTLVFHKDGAAVFDSTQKIITYDLQGDEALRMAAYFVLPEASGEVFHSTDDNFIVFVEYDLAGILTRINFKYQSHQK